MTDLERSRGRVRLVDQRIWLAWAMAISLLVFWVVYQLGGFDLWTTVPGPDGLDVVVPNTFATVDHPFHATRAEVLRRSLADGELLRWIGNHQGGYPVEFYPLGAAWIEVVVWALLLGTLPIMAVHKLVVIGVFLLPLAGFVLLGKLDRLTLGVAGLALAIHVSVRGWWWSGGYMELVEWGLLTNVASAAILPLGMSLMWKAYCDRSSRYAAVAAIVFSVAVYTNVRTVFPIAALFCGLILAGLIGPQSRMDAFKRGLVVAGISIALLTLLLAPLIGSLLRFGNLYVFVHYSGYDGFWAFFDSSVEAVTWPVVILAVFGVVLALYDRASTSASFVAITLIVYVTGTAIVASSATVGDLVSQLEATRLMPFQRLLTMYMAAFAVARGSEKLLARLRASRIWIDFTVLAAALVMISAYLLAWIPGVHSSDRAVSDIVTTGDRSFADLEAAVRVADATAPAGTSILVLGTVISWHDQLWAPQWSDRRFFYDDWLWYWQTDHVGDYDPLAAHAYDRDTSALSPDYLRQHGVGSVVVTGEARQDAASSPHLTAIRSGISDVYLVDEPVGIVSVSPGLMRSEIGNQEISASNEGAADTFVVRHNWFPRWIASIDGEPAVITKRPDGYFDVASDQPGSELVVTYRTDVWDWFARVSLISGGVVCLAIIAIPTRFRRQN